MSTQASPIHVKGFETFRVITRHPVPMLEDFIDGTNRYLLREGKLEPKSRYRGIVWIRTEGVTYFVCVGCRHLNRIQTSGLYLEGRHLYTDNCEVCAGCHNHIWYIFADWATRDQRGTMKRRPDACPLCKAKGYHHRNGYKCAKCVFRWRPA